MKKDNIDEWVRNLPYSTGNYKEYVNDDGDTIYEEEMYDPYSKETFWEVTTSKEPTEEEWDEIKLKAFMDDYNRWKADENDEMNFLFDFDGNLKEKFINYERKEKLKNILDDEEEKL